MQSKAELKPNTLRRTLKPSTAIIRTWFYILEKLLKALKVCPLGKFGRILVNKKDLCNLERLLLKTINLNCAPYQLSKSLIKPSIAFFVPEILSVSELSDI